MKLTFRPAVAEDAELVFRWANDPQVRANSWNTAPISWENHLSWFRSKIHQPQTQFLIFEAEGIPCGQVRFDQQENEALIGILVSEEMRGKGLSAEMLRISTDFYLKLYPGIRIVALIRKDNAASVRAFLKAGFGNEQQITHQGQPGYRLEKQ